MRSRQIGRSVGTIILDESQAKLPFWKRLYLWIWRKHHRKQISIWILKDNEEEE